MVAMNLETFLASSQDEIISWAWSNAEAFAEGELDITNEEAISSDELLFLLSAYKVIDSNELTVNVEGYKDFMRSAEAELRRRYTK
jgi:hypothetical protein